MKVMKNSENNENKEKNSYELFAGRQIQFGYKQY